LVYLGLAGTSGMGKGSLARDMAESYGWSEH